MQPATRAVMAVLTGLDAYQSALLRGIRDELGEAGVRVTGFVDHDRFLSNTTADPGVPTEFACRLVHSRPQGLVMTSSLSEAQDAALVELTTRLGIPVVHVGRDIPGQTCIRADNAGAMAALMAHLLDGCGARTPAMVVGLAHQPDHRVREEIFRAEVARRGLPVHEDLLVPGEAEREVALVAMRRLLGRRRDLDAVVTTDDWCALAVIEALEEAGLRVPDDVVVSGFDNYPIASLNWPGVTSVDQNLHDQGRTAARLLLEEIDGAPPRGEVLVPCRLVVRESTRGEGLPDDPVTARSIARLAHEHLGAHSGIRRISRALTDCRTLADVRDALATSLQPAEVQRCFVVVYDDLPPGEPGSCEAPADGIEHRTCRLLLDYRNGTSHPVPAEAFSSCAVLPPALQGELASGFLAYQPLIVTSGILGYLLTDHALGDVTIVEALRIDLARTLESVLNTRDLQAHSAMLEELVARRTSELEQTNRELQRANGELERLASMDGLTRIANRISFQRHLTEQWHQHARDGAELALLMVDVDEFKAYNDRHGHLCGDDALRELARCLQQACHRPGDLPSRFGGEEFAVVLPRTDRGEACRVARRFQHLLAEAAIPHHASRVAGVITASVGIAVTVPTSGLSPDALVAEADRALYRAKEQGRNRIVAAALEGDPAAPEGAPVDAAAPGPPAPAVPAPSAPRLPSCRASGDNDPVMPA